MINEEQPMYTYPNPFGNHFILEYYAELQETNTIQIFNVYGKLIWKNGFNCLPGTNKLPLALKNEPGGIYNITLQTPDRFITKIVMKQ